VTLLPLPATAVVQVVATAVAVALTWCYRPPWTMQ
jgi:hypothetical protein